MSEACQSKGIVYEAACAICHPEKLSPAKRKRAEGRIGIYIGESGRTLYERVLEHEAKREKLSEESFAVRHWITSHEELTSPPKFNYCVLKKFKDPMSRQVSEAVLISESKDQLLNTKEEIGKNSIPRMIIDNWEGNNKNTNIDWTEWRSLVKMAKNKLEARLQATPTNNNIDSIDAGGSSGKRKPDKNENDIQKIKRYKVDTKKPEAEGPKPKRHKTKLDDWLLDTKLKKPNRGIDKNTSNC